MSNRRDEAMREAPYRVVASTNHKVEDILQAVATAGADAERKRIVEWLRADSPGCSYVAEYELINAIERGDHWKESQ